MTGRLNSLLQLHEKEPDDAFLLYGIALEYISIKEYQKAEEYLSQLLKQHPGYVPGYMQYARLKETLNDVEAAREFYKKGIEAAKKENDLKAAGEMEEFLNELE